jgi:lipopolysaccharide export system protein LptC
VRLNPRNLLGFGLLAGLAVGSWYFSRTGLGPTPVADEGADRPLGYYLRGAEISIMDVDGSILYRIRAQAVEERPAENRTVLSRVHVRYSPAADVPWEVRAESGDIPADERYIELSGDVELSSAGEAGGEPTIIRAPRLTLAPDEFLATTDAPVSVLLGEERLEAVGMRADLKGDFLELESGVRGQFHP